MAFINEKGGLNRMVESQKYADLYNKQTDGNKSFILPQWTIDREREMLLICILTVRQDMYEGDFELSHWIFYWQGSWIEFKQKGFFDKVDDTYWKVRREITEIKMPLFVKDEQLKMFADLKEAFSEFKIIGCRSLTDYRCDVILDYSEVV